jgi:hypothetical protein
MKHCRPKIASDLIPLSLYSGGGLGWGFFCLALVALLSSPRPAPAQSTRPLDQTFGQSNRNDSERELRRQRRRSREQGVTDLGQTQPDNIPPQRPITGSYLILDERSIFYKGRFRPSGAGSEGPRTQAESVTVFIGVTQTDDALAAYLEDTESGTINTVHVGQQIAQGKITNITLDSLEYQAGSRVAELSVGQNLAGDQVWGGSQPTTLPSGVDLSGPNADILKKMMQRRLQELNGEKPN